MPRPSTRAFSRYSRDAVELLGALIRRARLERKMTAAQLAERAGLSRGLIQRIEKGDPGCAIGTAFEAAAIVGVRLFDADQTALSGLIETNRTILSLLPRPARAARIEAKGDFGARRACLSGGLCLVLAARRNAPRGGGPARAC